MLKQKKNLGNSHYRAHFHNKYIEILRNKLSKKGLLFKKFVKRDQYRVILARRRRFKRFKGCYRPRHKAYLRLLSLQKRYHQFLRARRLIEKLNSLKRLKKLLQLKKVKTFIKAVNSEVYKHKKKLLFKPDYIWYSLTLKIRRNNIFSTISICKGRSKKKLIFACSAGIMKIKLSKRTFKFNSRRVLNRFFNKARSCVKPLRQRIAAHKYKAISDIIIKKHKKITLNQKIAIKNAYYQSVFVYAKMISPVRTRKSLVFRFLKLLKRNKNIRAFVLNVLEKKVFNGCRPKKKKRKKRQGLRVFK